jgi:U4/U6 small nuclear ribonucleoprotein PRP31
MAGAQSAGSRTTSTGKRIRRLKENRALSEAAKAANRMRFGEVADDVDQNDLGYDIGMLGSNATGHLRAEATKTKAPSISKKMKQMLARQRQNPGGFTAFAGAPSAAPAAASTMAAGTASVAFTPVQGLALNIARAGQTTAAPKYFGNTFHFGPKK